MVRPRPSLSALLEATHPGGRSSSHGSWIAPGDSYVLSCLPSYRCCAIRQHNPPSHASSDTDCLQSNLQITRRSETLWFPLVNEWYRASCLDYGIAVADASNLASQNAVRIDSALKCPASCRHRWVNEEECQGITIDITLGNLVSIPKRSIGA